MSPLRTLSRDLVERRLWPLVAVLVAALVAIPALFLHSASSGGTQASAPGQVPAPATTASPVPASVPRAVRQLIDQTTATIAHGKVSGPIKDPFRLAEASGLSPAPPPASSTPSTASDAASSVGPCPGSSTPPAPSAGSGGGSSTPPSDGPKPGTPPKPVTPPDQPTKKSYDVYKTDVQYAIGDGKPKLLRDVVRLTALPSSLNPVAVFLGVEAGGRDAVFAISSTSRPTGAKACRPLPGTCLWLVVAPGKTVNLQVPDGKGGTTPEALTVVRIDRTTTSDSAAAMAAYQRADAAGRCVLGVLGAYDYDASTGVLKENPATAQCQYAQARSGKAAASAQPPGYLG